MTIVAVRAREHAGGVPTHSTLELVKNTIVLVEVAQLGGQKRWRRDVQSHSVSRMRRGISMFRR